MPSHPATAEPDGLAPFSLDEEPAAAPAAPQTADAPEISLTVPTDELRRKVKSLQSVAGRPTDAGPPLHGVRLDVRDRRVVLGATDRHTTHTIELPGTTTATGMLLVPAALLADILATVRTKAVTLAGGSDAVEIQAGRTSWMIYQLAHASYPRLPRPRGRASLTLPSETFAELAAAVVPTAGNDETRPILSQVSITAIGKTVQALTTDTYRAAICTFDLQQPVEEDVEVLVPASAMQRAALVAADVDGDVRIAENERNVAIQVGDEVIVTQRVSGAYPDVGGLVERRDEKRDHVVVTTSVERLLAITRRAATLIQKTTSMPLRLRFAPGLLTVRSATPDVGSFEESIAIDYDGEAVEIGIAPAFLQEALRFSALGGVDVTVRVAEHKDGVLLDAPGARYLVMPIRLVD